MKNTIEEIAWISRIVLFNDERAFGKLLDRYHPLVRRLMLAQTGGDEDLSDDLTQEVFIKVWLNIRSFSMKSRFSTWIYRIATNEAFNFLRKQKLRTIFSLNSSDSILVRKLEQDAYFNGDKLQTELQKAIIRLPEKQRIVFNLRYFEEMKYEDISEITGTSVGALKASYHHAYNKVKEEIQKSF